LLPNNLANKAEDISGTDRVRNFKFGVPIYRQALKTKDAKVGQSGVVYVT